LRTLWRRRITTMATTRYGRRPFFLTQQKLSQEQVAFLTDVATGDVFNVHGGANMIGRDPDCDVRIDNGSVSGLHAVLGVCTKRTLVFH